MNRPPLRSSTLLALVALASSTLGPMAPDARAQMGGNVGYGQAANYGQSGGGRARAEAAERAKRQPTKPDLPADGSAMYVDASVLVNRKADQFVATFGLAEQAETVEGCRAQMDGTVGRLLGNFREVGVDPADTFVDFSAQTKVYAFDIQGTAATERPSGFELKKTVAVRYKDKALIDRLVVAASKANVFDLVKVDYVVSDLAEVHEALAEEASKVIKAKASRMEKLLGIRLRAVPQVVVDAPSAYPPTEMYESYAASESEGIDRSTLTSIKYLRKGRTFYYNPLGPDGFDRVVDPAILEPVVQFTLYLRLRYEIETRR